MYPKILLYPVIRVFRLRASSAMMVVLMVLLLLPFLHRGHMRLKTSPTALASRGAYPQAEGVAEKAEAKTKV